MTYDLSTSLGTKSAMTRLQQLAERGCTIELVEKRPRRSLPQNSYLHLILSYFATQTGYTPEWVKQQIYKRHCNPDLFITTRQDPLLGSVTYLRSSRDLTADEMTQSIERFRFWSADVAGIYIPDACEAEEVQQMSQEVEQSKTYLI